MTDPRHPRHPDRAAPDMDTTPAIEVLRRMIKDFDPEVTAEYPELPNASDHSAAEDEARTAALLYAANLPELPELPLEAFDWPEWEQDNPASYHHRQTYPTTGRLEVWLVALLVTLLVVLAVMVGFIIGRSLG